MYRYLLTSRFNNILFYWFWVELNFDSKWSLSNQKTSFYYVFLLYLELIQNITNNKISLKVYLFNSILFYFFVRSFYNDIGSNIWEIYFTCICETYFKHHRSQFNYQFNTIQFNSISFTQVTTVFYSFVLFYILLILIDIDW